MNLIEVGGVSYEIKPRPFCGKTDRLVFSEKELFERLYAEKGSATVALSCKRCKVDMYEHDYGGDDYGIKAKILLNKWNERKEKR